LIGRFANKTQFNSELLHADFRQRKKKPKSRCPGNGKKNFVVVVSLLFSSLPPEINELIE
jgi:hypothetical protein